VVGSLPAVTTDGAITAWSIMTSLNSSYVDRRIAARSWWSTILATLIVWHQHHRTRRQLRNLDPRGLLDVGIDAAARDREVAKWCWQP
jgi:uncharacterized protein YjiS (DUF1127 family)